MDNILFTELTDAYKEKDFKKIYDITRMNLSEFKAILIDYLKTRSLDDIFLEITFFNICCLNENYNKLPIYFFDDNWILLEILKIEPNDILKSTGKVIESTFNGLKNELTIYEILNESTDGVLNLGTCFRGEN